MRNKLITSSLILAAALISISGCENNKEEKSREHQRNSSSSRQHKGPGTSHNVTLEVTGKGATQIFYTAATNEYEKIQLPWRKEIKINAEEKVREGRSISITPQSLRMQDSHLFGFPSCRIIVNGKTVDENKNEDSAKGCFYRLK